MEPDDLLTRLAAWSADQVVAEGAARRRRERWLRQQAAEEATLASVALDLCERRAPVVVQVRGGMLVRGTAVACGRDFVAVATDDAGVVALVPFSGLVSLRPGGNGPPIAAGPARPPLPATLAGALAGVAAERLRVRVVAADGEPVAGELVAVGEDLVGVALDGGGFAYVTLGALGCVHVLG